MNPLVFVPQSKLAPIVAVIKNATYAPEENKMLMLQETNINSLGAMIIYAPIELQSITLATNNEDPTKIHELPSGHVISSDGRLDQKGIGSSSISNTSNSSCSLLTVALQILVLQHTFEATTHHPYAPKENEMPMLQETNIDSLGAMIIYVQIELQSISSAMNGEDTTKIPVLPSGYVTSSDGRLDRNRIGASSSSNTSNSSGSLS
ncbi:homeobox-leucine zipper protein HDG11-like [Forsythia ovata]|uniref:Homeobox-leucine zipper protein HDG11-like n=1 Tax=Forsythia ovata TaxID=205694 RepID=A0ABD1UB07_9LAMI